MKEEIKNAETSVKYIISKQWKRIASIVKKILQTKIKVFKKLNKIDHCFYQIVLFVTRKN